ncbi:MAG: TusE/DsrC/DsvC family sulfur relay protein [Gammaproteobacteria bacterium]|nr:TusE/DsrC/DsvC family sulfur relay protein [Gammaproteobacteria bacterium]MDH5593386.1 TusE/DsrC/DsvC family sulfur relay protein [Gammaproteobacteria bacterium]MDH5613906.1 TusE/DsrC/DsvC family sulfur relay protein [Gammaproteobacteria bacterium]
MAYEIDGKTIETDKNGYLVEITDWTENVAQAIAKEEGIELTDKHWDLINFLRDEYINNGGNQPNTRKIVKAMSDKWGENLAQKDIYALFPKDPSKQGGRIGGLPESRRKGGY